jgi:hypothetical protein
MATKKERDYSKNVIYYCYHQNDLLYIGHSLNFQHRKNGHKTTCFNETNKDHNMQFYQYIRDNNIEWDSLRWEVEKYPCKDEFEALREEGRRQKKDSPLTNKNIAGRSTKEYREDHPEWYKEYNKNYYKDNAEEIKQNVKEYRENNIEKVKKTQKVYRENNKEYLSSYQANWREENQDRKKESDKIYYDKNKEKNKEKYTCECGSILARHSKYLHEKGQKHQDYMNSKPSSL